MSSMRICGDGLIVRLQSIVFKPAWLAPETSARVKISVQSKTKISALTRLTQVRHAPPIRFAAG
jgi:hypothetical protein